MEWQSPELSERMGKFHNQVVKAIDECKLSPPEVAMVLRILTYQTERLFETAVKERKTDGS